MDLKDLSASAPEASMTTSAQDTLAEHNAPKDLPEDPSSASNKKLNAKLKSELDLTKAYRKKLIPNWSTNIDYRRGKVYSSQSDQDRVSVPTDWAMTKTKESALFSQVPKVRIDIKPTAPPWAGAFEQHLNDTLVTAGIETAMSECLPDCINAAGIGVVMVGYEVISGTTEVPSIDMSILPDNLKQEFEASGTVGGQPVPMRSMKKTINSRYVVQRISPADFLWPLKFTGSNFDNAPWVGRSGEIYWAEGAQRFNLDEADKDKYTGKDKTFADRLAPDAERDHLGDEDLISFDEIFYKIQKFDSEMKSFDAIQHLVFVGGSVEPVIDEPWNGQELTQDFQVVGSTKFPIRVLTLSYISDEPIPPSDSAISRSQVDEINKLRSLNLQQIERNIPVRWFDVNRVDPTIQQALMRGTWQSFIPVQGQGDRVIGEVAKSGHPQENSMFDSMAKRDIQTTWGMGPNQLGSGADVETKAESGEIAQGFQTRTARERAKVASFVVGISEVLGSILCLYTDPSVVGDGFDKSFSKALSYSILADSTVLVDSNQRLKKINDFVNMYAKSGWVNLESVLKEAATLTGLDPNVTIQPPPPPIPSEPNFSYRFSGAADISNPLSLAIVLGNGKAPTAELIEQAKQLIQQAVMVPPPPVPGMPPTDPSMGPAGPMAPPAQPGDQPPPPPPTPVGEANPQMTILPTIGKRSESGGIQ